METKDLEKYLSDLGFELIKDKKKAIICFSNGLSVLQNKTAIQIAHPSFKQVNQYPYTPMVGYRGGEYLCELIHNTLTKAEFS